MANSSNSEHLQFIHDRIVNVYGESENVDFLIRLRKIISELKPKIVLDNSGSMPPSPKDPKFYNPKTKKTQKLFEDPLQDVWQVRYQNPLVGDKGECLYLVVEASDMEFAMNKAMANEEFTSHIYMKYYDKRYLTAYKPMGNYVIGKVIYFEGDPRT